MSVYQGYSKIFNKLALAALVLLIFVTGCGSGGGGGGGTGSGSGANGGSSGPPDNTIPTVTSMAPGEDTGGSSPTPGIGTNSKLTATLSEAMVPALITAIDPTTNNPANFRLTNGVNFISGTVSYDATNHIAVFTPTGALAPNIRYTATIITGIKDLGGNPLTRDFAWCFVTGGADSTAPGVTSTIPVNADAGVAINRKISATFSEEINSSTLTPANFTVTGPGASPVSGTVTYVNKTAVFTPSSGLASNTVYTATITTGVMDLAGNASQANVTTFTTGANADVTAPVVNSTDPASSPASPESGVAISKTISINFSEPMDPATITTANFSVTGPGATPVVGTVAYNASNNTGTFTRIEHLTTPVISHLTPVSNLEPSTTYTATLTTGAKDMAGNALANNLVWSFTTAP